MSKTSFHTKAGIPQAYRTVLLQKPIHAPVLIGLEKPAETALAMRVHDLFSFRRQGIPISVRPIGYQGKEGTWVVAVAFRITSNAAAPLEGIAYLNPRLADDYSLLQHLTRQ